MYAASTLTVPQEVIKKIQTKFFNLFMEKNNNNKKRNYFLKEKWRWADLSKFCNDS